MRAPVRSIVFVMFVFGIGASSLLPAPQASAATTTYSAQADARVEEANPGSNFATSTLRVDAGSGPDVESYVKFNVGTLSGSVTSATLRVYASSGTADGPAVYKTSTSWSETGVTWNNRPARTSGGTADKGSISAGTWVEFNVTSLVPGSGTYSFALAGTSSDGVDFHSREGTNKPQLVIGTGGGGTDTQDPSAPTNLRATAPSGTRVDLTWTASTDNVGVTGYDVRRSGTLIASVGTTTAYSDTTVSPSTRYRYTVKARDAAGNLSAASEPASVRTPAARSDDPVIATAGDVACSTSDSNYNGGNGTATACRQKWTSNLLFGAGYAAVLALGDLQYSSGSLAQYLNVYDPTWGRVKSTTRPVPGNHEYNTSGATGYYTYFGSLASPQEPSCTANCKGYYSFDVGAWHIIALNSNCSFVPCTANSAQETWLRQDLASHLNACTIAFDHHARWSSGHDGDNAFMQPMWQDLVNARAEILLSGHSHNYERFAPQNASGGSDPTNGVRQFVVGTGGAFFTSVGSPHANSQVRNNNTFGVLELTLHPTSYDWKFIPETGSGTFTDSGSTACH